MKLFDFLPNAIEIQTSKGFPVFSEEKTGNWTKVQGGGGKASQNAEILTI